MDVTNIKLKPNTNSDTSSSFNDSCYGSSEMDVYHHQSGNKLTGKILISSNDKFIILCKDQNNGNHDETNSSSSSSSPNGNNNSNLITRYQSNPRTATIQPYHAQTKHSNQSQNLEIFKHNNEFKKAAGSKTKTFSYRNVTPVNEYYL